MRFRKKYVVIRDMSAGNDTVGDMWQETKIFEGNVTLDEVMDWACPGVRLSKKRITLTLPEQEAGELTGETSPDDQVSQTWKDMVAYKTSYNTLRSGVEKVLKEYQEGPQGDVPIICVTTTLTALLDGAGTEAR